jgi:hypothetical protein
MANARQKFNVWLKMGNSEGRTVFFDGEKVDATIRSEADAHLFLASVDPEGNVCVILPGKIPSESTIGAHATVEIKGLGKVEPPFGAEFIKLFAFRNKVEGLDAFAAGDGVIDPTTEQFTKLLSLIRGQSDWAETSRQMVTMKAQ